MNEAFIYSVIGFFLLVLIFMAFALWINKRLRRYPPPMHPRQPNLQDPYTPVDATNIEEAKKEDDGHKAC